MCRHSIVAHLMDISTGERYVYAAVMLYALMVFYSIPVLFVWYDINCRFCAYFLHWATKHPALQAALALVTGGIKFPLPCFHRYSHRQVAGVACHSDAVMLLFVLRRL